MRRTVLWLALSLSLLGSACGENDQAATTTATPTPTPTSSPSPAAEPVHDFVLEGNIVEAWVAANSENGNPSASPAATPTGSSTDDSSPTASPAGQGGAGTDTSAPGGGNLSSGALAVNLTSYFAETGCIFKASDVVVVRLTPQTTMDPPELVTDSKFPANLERLRVTISGVLLNPGPTCLPVAQSVTLLEGGATATPGSATPRRARPRARASRATPSPTPGQSGPTGTIADPGGSVVGDSVTRPGGRDNDPPPDDGVPTDLPTIPADLPIDEDPPDEEEEEDLNGQSGTDGDDGGEPAA